MRMIRPTYSVFFATAKKGQNVTVLTPPAYSGGLA